MRVRVRLLADRVRLLLRLPADRPRLLLALERLRLLPPDRLRVRELPALPPARRRLVAAAFRAALDRDDLDRDAAARPPFLPPFLDELRLVFLPRPEPLFFPPPVSLFTVAHARRSASRRETPRFT
ncbi:MAG TPA: hypothetical protein VFH24_07030 [Gemmatimonadales bacterium]|nr:hypothetical protein [Gemmatimonadales bacterium]